jgi:hypothetical protein
MRSSILRFGIINVLALTTLSACEYEFKDEPAKKQEELEVEVDEDASEDEAKEEVQKQAAPPAARPTLAPGKAYEGSTTLPEGAKLIDLLNLEATNQATLTMNVPGPHNNLFDAADDTLVRTPGINPLDTTITLTAPTKIKALRVRSTYSDFAVAVQIDDAERIILDPIPDGDWATMVWATPITAKKVFVQILRKSRDNFVHANEIELYQ